MALLQITKREKLGSRHARQLRSKAMVPGIIYAHGEPNTPVSLRTHDIEAAVQHGERLLRAELDGKEENFLIKDVQYDFLGQQILHVDLARVRLDERVEVTVPVSLRGTPVGVDAEGGVLTQHLAELTVECLVTEIPEEVRAPVVDLHVNESLRVADLSLPENVKVLVDPETVVASVTVMAEEEVEVPAEGAATGEPEVIGEKPEEETPSEGREES